VCVQVCFAGGMFALGAAQKAHGALPEDNAPFMELGEQLTATCHETYKRSPSGTCWVPLLVVYGKNVKNATV
jgi:hypothetical protein